MLFFCSSVQIRLRQDSILPPLQLKHARHGLVLRQPIQDPHLFPGLGLSSRLCVGGAGCIGRGVLVTGDVLEPILLRESSFFTGELTVFNANIDDTRAVFEGRLTVFEGRLTVFEGGLTVFEGGLTVLAVGLTSFTGGLTLFNGELNGELEGFTGEQPVFTDKPSVLAPFFSGDDSDL